MRVKMKVKHLVISGTLMAAFIGAFILFLHPQIESWGISRQLSAGDTEEAKERIIEQIESGGPNRLELIEKYMIKPDPVHRYDIYVGPSMRSGPHESANRLFTRKETVPYLLEFVEEADPGDMHLKAAEILILHYASEDELDGIEHVTDQAALQYSPDDYNYHELRLTEIEQLLRLGAIDQAERLIGDYEGDVDDQFPDAELRLAMLKSRLHVSLDDTNTAVEVLNNAIQTQKDRHEERQAEQDNSYNGDFLQDSVYFQETVDLRNSFETMTDNDRLGAVEGRVVRSDGETVAGAGVYLRHESHAQTSISEDERYQTVTGPDGSYSFEGVVPDSYEVHIGLRYEQVDGWAWPVEPNDWIDVDSGDTEQYDVTLTPLIDINSPKNNEVIENSDVTFDWDDFPGAESYMLFLRVEYDGGSFGSALTTQTEEASLTVPVEDLYRRTMGIVVDRDDREYFEPEPILAFTNPEGEFSWYVHAFDENGDLIGQSDGYRLHEDTMGPLPFFGLQERELTEADRVLLEGDVEGALKMYKENTEDNRDDAHSLRMITRLNGLEGEHADETVAYRKKLFNADADEDNIFQIFMHYFDHGKWDEAEEWYRVYEEEADPAKLSGYAESLYGVTLVKLGETEQALDVLRESVSEDKRSRFAGYLLALEIHAGAEWDHVLALAAEHKERGHDATDWERFLNSFDEGAIGSAPEALKAYFSDKTDELEHYLMESGALRRFIELLDDVR